jgi:hypothetical protein
VRTIVSISSDFDLLRVSGVTHIKSIVYQPVGRGPSPIGKYFYSSGTRNNTNRYGVYEVATRNLNASS